MELTARQKECIDYEGDLLIEGYAGAGKTIALLLRADRLAKKGESVVVLTGLSSIADMTKKIRDDLKKEGMIQKYIRIEFADDFIQEGIQSSYLPGEEAPGLLGIQYSYLPMVSFIQFNNDYRQLLNIGSADKEREKMMEEAYLCYENVGGYWTKKREDDKKDEWKSKRGIEIPKRPEPWSEVFEKELEWIRRNAFTRDEYLRDSGKGKGDGWSLRPEEKKKIWEGYEKFAEGYMEGIMTMERVNEFCKSRLSKASNRFDHILVDEAQDCNILRLRFLRALAKKSITLAVDYNQRVFDATNDFARAGIVNLTKKCLPVSRRMTGEIYRLANDLKPVYDEETGWVKPEPRGGDIDSGNEMPRLIGCQTDKEKESYVCDKIKQFQKDGKIIASIGIICRSKKEKEHWMKILKEYSPRELSMGINEPGVYISSVINAKGAECAYGIIPDLEKYMKGTSEGYLTKEKNWLFVAVTRARCRLDMLYKGTSDQIEKWKHSGLCRLE